MNQTVSDRLNEMFKELVPRSGKAENLAGEIIRAIARIDYRFYNDGDHLGIGYGKHTCNPAGRFLIQKTNADIAEMVNALWGIESETAYEMVLDKLEEMVLDYVTTHPDLRNQPTPDMFDFRDKREDNPYDEE